jgi:hypothetical protein
MYLQSGSQFDANICLCKGTVVCEYLSVQRNVIRRMFVQGHAVMRIFVLVSVLMRIFICTSVCSNANIRTGECSNANIRAREFSNAKIFAAIHAYLLRRGKFACSSVFFLFKVQYVSKITKQSYSMHVFSFQ